jgi:hypothetical protein
VPMVCVDDGYTRVYFDPADVVDAMEPVDIASGRKPAGWREEVGGAIRVSVAHGAAPVTITFPKHVWPQVKALVGITDRVTTVAADPPA